ncbi:CoA-binding protein [Carboxylicivirga sp. N1Y90]|uniref:CoA-binding protein n=1 Tax=Carboxylicivirga fragile TaxID=3417571 RepID=UPI003D34ADE4|nr:CoA-binding protein [Marinilabiliaceae bacterium N1Y90]
MKVTKDQINRFFSSGVITIVGVSRNEKKFGRMVFNNLKKNGYQVIPVNPNIDEIDGQTCYKNIKQIPEKIESLLIISQKSKTNELLREALELEIENIWVQKESCTKELVQIAEEAGQQIIHNECIFMYAPPVKGIHKFHRSIVGLFGQLPK